MRKSGCYGAGFWVLEGFGGVGGGVALSLKDSESLLLDRE